MPGYSDGGLVRFTPATVRQDLGQHTEIHPAMGVLFDRDASQQYLGLGLPTYDETMSHLRTRGVVDAGHQLHISLAGYRDLRKIGTLTNLTGQIDAVNAQREQGLEGHDLVAGVLGPVTLALALDAPENDLPSQFLSPAYVADMGILMPNQSITSDDMAPLVVSRLLQERGVAAAPDAWKRMLRIGSAALSLVLASQATADLLRLRTVFPEMRGSLSALLREYQPRMGQPVPAELDNFAFRLGELANTRVPTRAGRSSKDKRPLRLALAIAERQADNTAASGRWIDFYNQVIENRSRLAEPLELLPERERVEVTRGEAKDIADLARSAANEAAAAELAARREAARDKVMAGLASVIHERLLPDIPGGAPRQPGDIQAAIQKEAARIESRYGRPERPLMWERIADLIAVAEDLGGVVHPTNERVFGEGSPWYLARIELPDGRDGTYLYLVLESPLGDRSTFILSAQQVGGEWLSVLKKYRNEAKAAGAIALQHRGNHKDGPGRQQRIAGVVNDLYQQDLAPWVPNANG